MPVLKPAALSLTPGETGSFSLTGGVSPYTWIVEEGGLSTTQGSTNTYIAPQRAGVYSIRARDGVQHVATAQIQVSGTVRVTPVRSFATPMETITLRALGGEAPYQWLDGAQGERWSGHFAQPGRHEIVVQDQRLRTALAVVDVVRPNLTVTPPAVSLTDEQSVQNFHVNGGIAPYAWNVEAGTLANPEGDWVAYVPPAETGVYNLTVEDSAGSQAVTFADPEQSLANPGLIEKRIRVNEQLRPEPHISASKTDQLDLHFWLHTPTDGKQYQVYAAVLLSEVVGKHWNYRRKYFPFYSVPITRIARWNFSRRKNRFPFMRKIKHPVPKSRWTSSKEAWRRFLANPIFM